MASQIFQFPKVMAGLRARGYHLQVGLEQLKVEVKRVTGITKDATLVSSIKDMCLLGYLKDQGSGTVFYISQGGLYDFPQAKKAAQDEIEEEVDKHMQNLGV